MSLYSSWCKESYQGHRLSLNGDQPSCKVVGVCSGRYRYASCACDLLFACLTVGGSLIKPCGVLCCCGQARAVCLHGHFAVQAWSGGEAAVQGPERCRGCRKPCLAVQHRAGQRFRACGHARVRHPPASTAAGESATTRMLLLTSWYQNPTPLPPHKVQTHQCWHPRMHLPCWSSSTAKAQAGTAVPNTGCSQAACRLSSTPHPRFKNMRRGSMDPKTRRLPASVGSRPHLSSEGSSRTSCRCACGLWGLGSKDQGLGHPALHCTALQQC